MSRQSVASTSSNVFGARQSGASVMSERFGIGGMRSARQSYAPSMAGAANPPFPYVPSWIASLLGDFLFGAGSMRQSVTGEARQGGAQTGGGGGTDWLKMQARPPAHPLARLPGLPAALRRMGAAAAQNTNLAKLLACHGIASAAAGAGRTQLPQVQEAAAREESMHKGGTAGGTPASPQEDESIRLELLWEWVCPEAAGLNVACMAWNQVLPALALSQIRLRVTPHAALHASKMKSRGGTY